ncbi:hypothetical protein JTE90_016720, partial [Oedothorax gibbosus]
KTTFRPYSDIRLHVSSFVPLSNPISFGALFKGDDLQRGCARGISGDDIPKLFVALRELDLEYSRGGTILEELSD